MIHIYKINRNLYNNYELAASIPKSIGNLINLEKL